MSAPKTNVEKQKSRHRPALWGIAAALVFAAVMFLLNLGAAVDEDGPLADEVTDEDALLLEEDSG